MTDIKFGEIFLCQFPFTSGKVSKRRPVLVLFDLESDAVKTLEGLGFQSYVMPQYGTDPDGNQHDMTKLILRL